MAELLFEIGSEEIPAAALGRALEDLASLAEKKLTAARLTHSGVRVLGTPRRLALIVHDVAERQEDLVEELIGPPARVAFDGQGQPTKAALAFAAKVGVDVAALKVVPTEKGDYLGARRETRGRQAEELLPDVLAGILRELPFKKSMRWADHDETFVRPVRWLLALFGGRVVPVTFAGVTSGNTTRGHRFLFPEPFPVATAEEYVAKLRERSVIVDPRERRNMVLAELRRVEQETGFRVIPDDGLVDEVTHLVEYPVGLCGAFAEEFLEVPKEVIIAAMRGHQRYFAMVDDASRLVNRFVTIAATPAQDMSLVRRGNERVLAARLADARFFYAEDQKVPLVERVARLEGMVFVGKLGNQAQRVKRIRALALGLAQVVGADLDHVARAAELCKADLTTQMVGEFPELQGVMGRDYALRQGEPAEVAQALYEHYLPRGATDVLPEGLVGAVLGVADRADTIVGCFGVGLQPTGSADPYALRRAAIGILQIILARKWRLSLKDLAYNAARGYENKKFMEAVPDVLEFFKGRLRGLLAESAPTDVVEAVLAVGAEDAVDALARAKALAGLKQREDFEPIATTFKRVANILKGEEVSDVPLDFDGPSVEPEEKALWEAFRSIEERVRAKIAAHEYDGALLDLVGLRPPVDLFFDKVLVMAEDPLLRGRRLGLLGRINRLFASIADFRQLAVQ